MQAASSSSIVDRILSRLEAAELDELDPHLKCDYRIAWITVICAARGTSQPHVAATYKVLGLHPDRVWSAIVARRKALLGTYYAEFWGEDLPTEVLPPKKPVRSERVPLCRRAAA